MNRIAFRVVVWVQAVDRVVVRGVTGLRVQVQVFVQVAAAVQVAIREVVVTIPVVFLTDFQDTFRMPIEVCGAVLVY